MYLTVVMSVAIHVNQWFVMCEWCVDVQTTECDYNVNNVNV